MANALAIILEPRNGLFDQIANAIVVFHEVLPVHFAGGQGGLRQTGDNQPSSERSIGEAGLSLPDEACTIDIESSTVIDCQAAGLQVKLGAAQTRQNKGLFRRQEM